jgi:hypothetical protein
MFGLFSICALLILSLTSISLQIAGISGCDYVRIHFKALNDNGIYFKDDPYIGLGLYTHQIFTEKNTRDWVFDSTCKRYDQIESNMFMEGNLSASAALSLSSIMANGIVILGLLVFGARRIGSVVRGVQEPEIKATTSAILSIGVSILSAASLALQAVAIDNIHDEGGICDRDSYFPDQWNVKFPFQIYPSYAYFKYFHECKLGPDGHRAKASIAFGSLFCAIALVSAIVTLMQIRDEDSSSSCSGRGSIAAATIMASFPVKTGSEKTRNSKKKSKQMEKRGFVSYTDESSDIPSGESSDADATVSMEYDEEELSFDAPSSV